MKKFKPFIMLTNILLITLSILPIKAIDVPKANNSSFVQDFADVISEETEAYINAQNAILKEDTGAEIIIVSVSDTGGYEIEDFTYEMFNEYGIGASDKNNGVLLLLAINDDNYWLMVGNGLENDLTGGILKSLLLDYLETDFAKQAYDAGAKKTFDALYKKITAIYQSDTGDVNQDLQPIETIDENNETESIFKTIFTIVIAIIVILAIIVIISLVYASIKKKERYYDPRQANDYHNPTYHRPTILPFSSYNQRNRPIITKKSTHTNNSYTPPRPTINKSAGSMFTSGSRSMFSGRSSGFRSFGGGRSRGGGAGRK